jgi:hypothetical protein
VTHTGDDRVTIDAEEELIEMYLVLNLRPRVEEITDEYWHLVSFLKKYDLFKKP